MEETNEIIKKTTLERLIKERKKSMDENKEIDKYSFERMN